MNTPQCIVYVLKNCDEPPRYYTGVTSDLGARVEAHNAASLVSVIPVCSSVLSSHRIRRSWASSRKSDNPPKGWPV